MAEKNTQVLVSKEIGKVSASILQAKKPIAVLVIAHGAGAGKDHPFMKALALAFQEAGITTIRYNFPFMENKKGRPDTPIVAGRTVAAAIAFASKKYSKLPLFAGGKSFGGRMTSQLLSKTPDERVTGLVFFGFPLHPPGAPDTKRAEHLRDMPIPSLFLQGTRDALAEEKLIKGVVKKLPNATLMLLEGADHSFKSGKSQWIGELAEATKAWIEAL
ncbi:MAG TPA: dienelactone hydrolase family protein [Cyclobacteriaceae bacterium]|nr:dienelactone hydrolase family protein [Cyclobacteriaceae bacterium]